MNQRERELGRERKRENGNSGESKKERGRKIECRHVCYGDIKGVGWHSRSFENSKEEII